MTKTCVGTESAFKAEFSLDVVQEALQEVLEEPEQASLLWAAYLFGLNLRRQVRQADATDDSVVLWLGSEEDRDGALEIYQRWAKGEEE